MPQGNLTSNVPSQRSPIITRNYNRLHRIPREIVVNMPDNTDNVFTHEIITTVADLPKFSGEPDTITLNQFIQRINTFIANKGIVNEKLKIEALKQHVDVSKGLARHVIIYSHLEDIDNYDDYVTAFKKHFTQESDRDPLRAMAKCLAMKINAGESQTQFLARLDSCAKDMGKILKNSKWIKTGSPDDISVSSVLKMIMMGHVINTNQGVVVERLHRDLKPTTHIGEIDCLLKGYAETSPSIPHYESSILAVKATPKSPQPPHRSSRTPTRGDRDRDNTHHRQRSTSRHRNNITCYTCNRTGHTAKQCYSQHICKNCQYQGHLESYCRNLPWCSHHQRVGHRTDECRAKNKTNSQNFQKSQDHTSSS